MKHTPQDLLKALGLMHAALDLIDQAAVACNAGAHLDLAICRLSDFVGVEAPTHGRDVVTEDFNIRLATD